MNNAAEVVEDTEPDDAQCTTQETVLFKNVKRFSDVTGDSSHVKMKILVTWFTKLMQRPNRLKLQYPYMTSRRLTDKETLLRDEMHVRLRSIIMVFLFDT